MCCFCKLQFPPFQSGSSEINVLSVKCSSANRGCEWEGTVAMLDKHLSTCGVTLIPCPKQCKDASGEVKCLTRKDLEHHLKRECPHRDYKCKSKCGEKGTYEFITGEHDRACKLKIIPCPNAGCDTRIQRQQLSEHLGKCVHTPRACKYKGIGCDTELKGEDLAAHELNDKIHLHIALEAVNELQETAKFQQIAIESLQAAVKTMLQVEVDLHSEKRSASRNMELETFKLPDYQKKKESCVEFQFPPFYTHPNGYRLALLVDPDGHDDGKGTHLSVYAPVVRGEYNAVLEWPLLGKVTCTLLNQLEDKNHHTGVINFTTTRNAHVGGTTWGFTKFIPHSALAHDPVMNTQYLKNDTLYFKVAVETERQPVYYKDAK